MAPKPAAFSRLQLAAALIEYDNDPDNPDTHYRSAHESAIFAHLRRQAPLDKRRRSADYLGVQVPSEVGSDPANRRSKASIGALRNPFGNADEEEDSGVEDNVEVDLTSWGLDAFVDKEKGKGKGKGKGKSDIFPNPHPDGPPHTSQSIAGDVPRKSTRSISIGTLNDFGAGGAFLDAESDHLNSLGRVRSSVDLDQLQSPQLPLQRSRASTHELIETLPVQPPLHSVPFPSISVSGRSSSPGPEEILRPGSRGSRLDLQTPHTRTQSNASLGSKALLNDVSNDGDGNPFAVRPPSPDRASRFDPKVNRTRTTSNGSVGTMAMLVDDNASRLDPKTHGRTLSVNSMGTRMLLENDAENEPPRDRPLSTLELLRPKVLVMPSPLQSVAAPAVTQPAIRPRSGFQTSADGSPFPPGARSRPAPIASNSFTPNPRASLTLSQLAFRNTLIVGGQRDIAFSDLDRYLPRAMKDGEQAHFEIEEFEESPPASTIPLPPDTEPTEIEMRRPAGKLYGRSLIDNLEQRKLQMKQMARTFTGDNRPSMMARGQISRSSALIDPESLGPPPTTAQLGNRASTAIRRNSITAGPLLDMNGEKPAILGASASTGDLPRGRSVFGVDTLWDREMDKLKQIEAQERIEQEERRRREWEQSERRQRKKIRKNGRSKAKELESSPQLDQSAEDATEVRVSNEPPTLPAIQKPILKRTSVADDATSDSESDEDDDEVPLGARRSAERAADTWVAESSDEDDKPIRMTGIGPRFTRSPGPLINGGDEDSEEDLPLTAAAERIAQRSSQLPSTFMDDDDEDLPLTAAAERIVKRAIQFMNDDDDEDKPLAAVLHESNLSVGQSKLSLPTFNFDEPSGARPSTNDDDDEQPLGLRASRIPAMASSMSLPPVGSNSADDEDDKPLAFHPQQQWITQNHMLAQVQQQQQQQMMMHAQMQNGFYFGAPGIMGSSMMGPGFFAPPMGMGMGMGMGIPQMMGIPVTPPSPPPVHDPAKFGRVDRWRHDVAVEDEE